MSGRAVVHDPDARRYELREDGALLGFAEYLPGGPSMIIAHTEIDAGREGEGLGSELIRGMLEQIRAGGSTVIPNCPFTAGYIARHPEFVPLVDPSLRARFGGAAGT